MRIVLNIALIVGLVVAAPVVGLFVSVGAYLVVHFIVLGVRPVVFAVAVALGVSLVMYGFFGLILGVEMRNAWLV
jgi:hypothetical protein